MKWIPLTSETQVQEIVEKSSSIPQVIFKYSSRCSISDMVKDKLERESAPILVEFYFLDLIAYRSLSDKVSRVFQVHHESPQILLIKNGECVYDESHWNIRMDIILSQLIPAA